MRTVVKAFLRYLPRRRSLSLLQVVGIACGVAAVIGMVVSSRSALSSFTEAMEFLSGKATHSMERFAGPLEETLLVRLMHDPAVRSFSPVIERRVRLESGEPLRLLGIDPFLDGTVRPQMIRAENDKTDPAKERGNLLSFLLDERAVILDRSTALRLGLKQGDTIITSKGKLHLVDTFSTPTPEPLILMDIGHAQELFNLRGKVDRVDLTLSVKQIAAFRNRWGGGFRIQSLEQKEQTYRNMLRAFR